MSEWTRSDTIEGNGYFWENTSDGISAFEDTSEGYSQFYAWRGDTEQHDNTNHSPVMATLAEAVAAIPE